ncbi:MAG: class I SAM-dependent methyltransferase [Burkholderiales bacterium]|jgi:ubiquinone/menaquinone biosynthesis C-methylase UbiE|nr:class I SAM-dependent methyltransferase [Burkholderiales bacterium]
MLIQRRRLLASALVLPAAPALSALLAPDEAQAREARPLDVPFVPTPMQVVDAMLDMAKVGKDDLLYDLGSGDGRIVIRAAQRFGCRGVGVDLNPERVREAKAAAKKAGAQIESLVRFEEGDVFTFDFSPATVVTMYLLPSVNVKLRPRILKELKPGTRIVSHDFDMGEWKAEDVRNVANSTVYRWTIMANPPANLLR